MGRASDAAQIAALMRGGGKRRMAWVVIAPATLRDGSTLKVGEYCISDYPGQRERPECFAREGTPAAKAALAKVAKMHREARAVAESKKPKKIKARSRLEIVKERRQLLEAPLAGELPRPAWAIGSPEPQPAEEVAEMRETMSPVSIRLSASARQTIIEDAQAVTSHERGAGLVGMQEDGGIFIVAANGTSPAARSGTASFIGDRGADFFWARQMQEMHGNPALSLLGDWHSHPSTNGDCSPGDVRSWSATMEARDKDMALAPSAAIYCGLIVGLPSRRSPVIEGYVLSLDPPFRRWGLSGVGSEMTS